MPKGSCGIVNARLSLVVACGLLAGCTAPGTIPPPSDGPTPPWVVVAVVDTGINPYHEDFRTEDPGVEEAVQELRGPNGLGPIHLRLTFTGTFEANREADRDLWAGLSHGTLYWFEGTRILGYSTSVDRTLFSNTSETMILDDFGHGTPIASVILTAAPSALILAVETDGFDLEEPTASPPVEGLNALERLSWVDVINLSMGLVGGGFKPSELEAAAATERLTARGTSVVASAGNDPHHPITSPFAGPPWVIAVSGTMPDHSGREPYYAQTTDVVATATQWAASHNHTTAYEENFGTSFAAPVVAGVLAHALHLLRAEGHDVAATDLRPFLNQTATYWGPQDWRLNTTGGIGGLSAPILLPWQQMGWGYVGPEHAAAIAQAYLGTLPPPPKPPEAVAYMEAQQDAREAYWSSRTR
jgi:subtilisin family serine protease